jgi:uncharacterized RDD family membrane protein YckC
LLCWARTFICLTLTTQFLGTGWWYPAWILVVATLVIPGWMFRDNDRRGLHDYVAGTRVLVEG